jgi:hypothetical protein
MPELRQITDHKIDGIDNQIDINVLDKPGAGGACHEYQITAIVPHIEEVFVVTELGVETNVKTCDLGIKEIPLSRISFQNGSVLEAGINGITQEALITVCIDRLRCFQAGDFACDDNLDALTHLEAALACLQKRTRDRLSRGVEGGSVL